MKKTMSRKTYRLLIICLAVCLMACGALGTYAYFVSQKSGSGSQSFGKIEFTLGNSDGNNIIDEKLPVNSTVTMGGAILSKDISIKADANSSGMYIRFKVTFSCDDTNMAGIIEQLNDNFNTGNAGYDNFKSACSATRDTDGWVYYTDDQTTPIEIKADSDAVTILATTSFCIPTGLTGTPTSSDITVKIDIESIQSANITKSLAGVRTAFEYVPKTESN